VWLFKNKWFARFTKMEKYHDEITEVCNEIIKDGYCLGKVTEAEIKEFETDNFIRIEGFNTPPFMAVKRIKPRI
jgi:hypothetical protein